MKAGSSVFFIFVIFVSAFAASGYLISQNQNLTQELEAARLKSSDLEGLNHSQAATIQEQQKQIEQKSGEVNQLTAQYHECTNTRQELRTKLDETRFTLDTVVASKTELESQMIALQEALGSAQAQAQQTGQTLQEMQNQLGEKDNRIAELQQGVDQAKQKILVLQDQLDRKMSENADLQSKVNELIQQVMTLNSRLEEAQQPKSMDQILEPLSGELPDFQHVLKYALFILIPGGLIMLTTLRIPLIRKQQHSSSLPSGNGQTASQVVWVKMTRQSAKEYAQRRHGQRT